MSSIMNSDKLPNVFSNIDIDCPIYRGSSSESVVDAPSLFTVIFSFVPGAKTRVSLFLSELFVAPVIVTENVSFSPTGTLTARTVLGMNREMQTQIFEIDRIENAITSMHDFIVGQQSRIEQLEIDVDRFKNAKQFRKGNLMSKIKERLFSE